VFVSRSTQRPMPASARSVIDHDRTRGPRAAISIPASTNSPTVVTKSPVPTRSMWPAPGPQGIPFVRV
jgi:hypothetical protein